MKLNEIILKFVRISFSILVVLLVVFGLTKIGMAGYEFGYRVFTEEAVSASPGKDITVQITSDMSDKEVGEMLEEKGLIRDANLFYVQLKLSSYAGKLQQGVYVLNTSMEPKEIMTALSTAKEEDTETESVETEETTEETTETEPQTET
ncbi:MAG: endolytic transglycosylase MltG [Roseburia sp.]